MKYELISMNKNKEKSLINIYDIVELTQSTLKDTHQERVYGIVYENNDCKYIEIDIKSIKGEADKIDIGLNDFNSDLIGVCDPYLGFVEPYMKFRIDGIYRLSRIEPLYSDQETDIKFLTEYNLVWERENI